MEVKQCDMTQEIWDEWSALIRDQECAVCGGQLTIHTVPERAALALGCTNTQHTGFRQRTSLTTEFRRGADIHPAVQGNIDKKMMPRSDLQRAMNLLAMRFPTSIKDIAGAALFINDCMRLGLDPLIQPAEAVPIPFKTKDKAGHEKYTVAMIVTEDGALSMAARGCREEYGGAPATMPLLDYLMQKHPQRPAAELQEMAKRTADELSGDPGAYVWVALGKRKSATEVNPVYGYYTQAERKKAQTAGLPAGSQPGNQARVRAVKRWVRENYPEARQQMLAYTAELAHRSAGVKEAQDVIDAEYTIITGPLISPPEAKPPHPAKPPRTQQEHASKREENKEAETAQQSLADTQQRAEDTLFPEEEGPENAEKIGVSPAAAAPAGSAGADSAESPRAYDKRMIYSSASKLGWNGQRLKKELKERFGIVDIDQLPDDKLHDVASKITDLATCV